MRATIPKVIGHRGACGHAPENTKVSMTKAHQLGVNWVEFDVMLAGCREVVVIHDETLERTTNYKGLVCETPYVQISNLDAGSWFSNDYANERVPSFKDLLAHLAFLDMGMNIEVKPVWGYEADTARLVLQQLNDYWPRHKQTPLLSSFSETVLAVLRESDRELALGHLIDKWYADWEIPLLKYNCQSLHIDYRELNRERVSHVKNKGYDVLSYTVNDPNIALELFAWGVDGVFSDLPDKILSAL